MSRLTPDNYPVILAFPPQAASTITDANCQAINLENANGVLIVMAHAGTSDNDVTVTIHEGASATVANAGTYPLGTGSEFQIWVNTATATNDTLAKQTNAVTYTINSDAGGTYLLCYYVPASCLTNGRSWISIGVDAGHASNFFTGFYILDGVRYGQTTPPTAVA